MAYRNERKLLQSTLHIVSTPYSEHFGETLQWRFIEIVSLALYSEPLHRVNKILLQIVFTIWRVDCILYMEIYFTKKTTWGAATPNIVATMAQKFIPETLAQVGKSSMFWT